MIHDLSKFVRFLSKHKITAHEFMLPFMLYLDEKVNINGYEKYPNDPSEGTPIANLYRYAENCRGWTPDEIQNLEDRGLIINKNVHRDGRKVSAPDMMEITELFRDEIFAPETRWEEFVQAYPVSVPHFHDSNKPNIPLQTVSGPGEWEALEKFYNKLVRTRILHDKIIELVKWGKEHGYINMNISKFVASKQWIVLQEHREKHVDETKFLPEQL